MIGKLLGKRTAKIIHGIELASQIYKYNNAIQNDILGQLGTTTDGVYEPAYNYVTGRDKYIFREAVDLLATYQNVEVRHKHVSFSDNAYFLYDRNYGVIKYAQPYIIKDGNRYALGVYYAAPITPDEERIAMAGFLLKLRPDYPKDRESLLQEWTRVAEIVHRYNPNETEKSKKSGLNNIMENYIAIASKYDLLIEELPPSADIVAPVEEVVPVAPVEEVVPVTPVAPVAPVEEVVTPAEDNGSILKIGLAIASIGIVAAFIIAFKK
jgi:hypothetical protein